MSTVLALESDSARLSWLHKAFKENLLADLSPDGFADMFAQTITYGLFTARASRESGALVAWHLLEHPAALVIGSGPHPSPLPGGEGVNARWFGTDFALAQVAEKSRELADASPSTSSGRTDKVGKVFINATSGFANVHQPIWQHTIGGWAWPASRWANLAVYLVSWKAH